MHLTCTPKFITILLPVTLHATQPPATRSCITPHHQPMSPPKPSPSTNHQQRFTHKKRKFTIQTESLTHTHTSKRKKKPITRHSKPVEETRKWAFSTRDCSNYRDRLVFVSYNILGVENAANHKDLYLNVNPRFLNWEYRRRVICKEIRRYSPSILCFQEVDRFDDLNKILNKDGYRGVYQARTGEARDGCAIFWKYDLFSLMHEDSIEFKQFGLRDNVAQFCVLKMNGNKKHINNTENLKAEASRSILVGNVHVLFNPSRGDIKLGQVRLFLGMAHRLSEKWGNIPIVLGGDLNSMPQSAIYQFIASSELNVEHHERKKISGQICPSDYSRFGSQHNYFSRPSVHNYRWSREELRLATGTEDSTFLAHNLKLHSAYHAVPGSRLTRDGYGEPLATSFHSKFMGTVDYIWHTEDLVPVRVVETLPTEILRKTGGLPSKRWGSDHLALVCEFAFADNDDACKS